jgi:hypothetical protein
MKNAPLLCASPRCGIRGRHAPGCEDTETCRGCLPRQAADGIYLCDVHARRIGEDALVVALRYNDLGQALTSSSSALGDIVSGSKKETGLQLNEKAAEMRMVIKHRLVSTVRMISEERGLPLPEDRVPALARYIARHAQWIAAHPAAADLADELAETASEAFHIAQPSGARRYQLKDPAGQPVVCRATVEEGEACPGSLWTILRRVDSLLPSELVCDHDNEHFVPADKWLTFGRQWAKEHRQDKVEEAV